MQALTSSTIVQNTSANATGAILTDSNSPGARTMGGIDLAEGRGLNEMDTSNDEKSDNEPSIECPLRNKSETYALNLRSTNTGILTKTNQSDSLALSAATTTPSNN